MTALRPQWKLQHRIGRAREEAGMTQSELADRIQVDAKTVSNWETGRHRPRRRDLMAIAQVTGVDLEWLSKNDEVALASPQNVRSAKHPPPPAGMAYHARRRVGVTYRYSLASQ